MMISVFCFLLLIGTGCASVMSITAGITGRFGPPDRESIPWVYSGVRNDLFFIQQGDENGMLCVLDLPLSFGMDTALLPFTWYAQEKWGNISRRRETEAVGFLDQHKGFAR